MVPDGAIKPSGCYPTCAEVCIPTGVSTMKISRGMFAGVSLLALSCVSALAQQVTGVPGSPGATTAIDGKQLPPPDPKFGGVIKEKASESTAWWAPRVVPPKGAPNVLLIMTDDVGFGAPGTFGGVVPTPALDRIAAQGLRFTNFHSTALCSPTRAALITGRNHHSVGNGVVGEGSTGFPGYDSTIPLEKGTIGTILRENGYATSWFGKNHNTPSFQASQAGPFNQWPSGMDSNTSTVSSAAMPASGSRICFVIRLQYIRSREIPPGTWRRRWPTRPSST
jgi:Sulfatase